MTPIALALLVLCAALPARADELERLRDENARLRQRVEQLERENATPAIPTRVVERAAPDGTMLAATEPSRIDVTGSRAAHWLWLERAAGRHDATLWIRTEFSGGIYRHTERLALRLDGAEQVLPIASYDATRITTGVAHRPLRRDHEVVSVIFTPPVLAALAGAASMSGQLGRTAFTVSSDVLASLRALARQTPTPP
jgi:hypothetical protein